MDLPHLALKLRTMELYLYIPIHLHGMMRYQLSPDITLLLPFL